ncbi:MAG: metal-dependent hydrolase [Pseudobacteriovorax sp.]|nr:metal-dependent hydrolase [Pseudobacteriovorax sp.]
MDSITQLTLGAAVSEAIVGKHVGRKAAAWGAFLGTFPDLDVFIPMGNPVADFVYHRSFSHSLIVLAALTPLWTWIILRIHKNSAPWKQKWTLAVLAVFFTHALLDSLTIYGTQIFWPITRYPVSIGSMFIVDPGYTVPLLLGVLIYLISRKPSLGARANSIGLVLSTAYLIWSLGVQQFVKHRAVASLEKAGLPVETLMITPTPFNTLLWRLVSVGDDGYHVGYTSIFDESSEVSFRKIPSRYDIAHQLRDHPPVAELTRFTHGLYSVDLVGINWVISDIRMGVEPGYVFQFAIARQEDGQITPIPPERQQPRRDLSRLGILFDRIFDESVSF